MRLAHAGLVAAILVAPASAAALDQFESAPVHPLEVSAAGGLLYAVHTADHRLVIFDAAGPVPDRVAEIPVGLDPVTVRQRPGAGEVWVVNHLSDSISIVDVARRRVVDTIIVGDEPTDVVFAGDPLRAFVCLSQEDRLLVLDPDDPHAPGLSVPLQGSDPRALAVSVDGREVYVAIHESGNRTTAIGATTVEAFGGLPAPDPPMDPSLPAAPSTGLVVRYDGVTWRDEAGGDWGAAVPWTLVDQDVFAIDASSFAVTRSWEQVGTHLFNLAVHPLTGELVVTNQEAHNEIRFEPKLQGVFVDSRVSLLGAGGGVTVEDLNPHVDRALPGDAGTRAMSVSLPLDVLVAPDGGAIYVAAFGSAKVAVLDGSGRVQRRIPVGGGPSGLALQGDRLYVLERFASQLAWVDLQTDQVERTPLGFDPTPADVRAGRAVFYDAANSRYGDLSCASCHLFGGLDNLSWDLGDPTGSMIAPAPAGDPLNQIPDFHPMKGPMTTQSLKGLGGTEPLHWRGDRVDLASFNPAFVSLLGADAPLSAGDFALLESFVLSLRYPSNPFRELDGALPATLEGADPVNGETLYLRGNLVGGLQCASCHALPSGENGLIIPANALMEDEAKVVPQLRNLYEKTRFDSEAVTNVRGFGFTHDGSVDDLFTFLQFPGFSFASDADRRDVAAFLLAFDTGTPPALGAQWCATGAGDPAGEARLATLEAEADLGRIALIAKGSDSGGVPRGWEYVGGGQWAPDAAAEPNLSTAALLAAAGPGTEITFTGVPLDEGHRLGVDRDLDGALDADEVLGGGDPGDPQVQPDGTLPTAADPFAGARLALNVTGPVPASDRARFLLRSPARAEARVEVYDLRGRRVRTLFAGAADEGQLPLVWDLTDARGHEVGSGVYLVRAESGGTAVARKLTVVR